MKIRWFLTLSFAVISTSCSDAPKPASAESKAAEAAPPQPVSAKTAFWEMYKSAYAWQKDKVALKMESKSIPGFKNQAGKAAQWTAVFGSPGVHQDVTFTYTVVAIPPDVPKGVMVGRAVPWSGPQREALPIETTDFKIDSDEAYKTAAAGAKDWIAKHPDQADPEISLGNASRYPGPVWSFLWGTRKVGYLALVSAVTGNLEKPGK